MLNSIKYMNTIIGRIVIYKTTEVQRKEMEEKAKKGECNVQEKLPGIVVAVWSDTCVNLNVPLDGEGSLWVTSSQQGQNEGEWNWPEKV